MKRSKKYIKASQINKNPYLLYLAKQKLIRIDKSKIHFYRWQYCLSLLMRELMNLDDKRITDLFDKYHCVVMEGSVGLLFPEGFNEQELPEKLRIRRKK